MNKLSYQTKVTEVDDIVVRLIAAYNKYPSLENEASLQSFFVSLRELSNQITEAIKRDVALSRLKDADNKRDETIRILHNVLLGYASMRIESIKPHGEKLFSIFSKYGTKIIKESYTSKSSFIEALLKDLAASDLQPSIEALLGVKESIADLRKKQTSFASIRLSYETTLVEQANEMSASELKKVILKFLNKKMIPYISVMKDIHPDQYKSFADIVSQIITSTNDAVKRRNNNSREK